MSFGNLKDGNKMVQRGRFSLDDLLTEELKLKIKYLLEHPELEEKYPIMYQVALEKLQRKYKERNKK